MATSRAASELELAIKEDNWTFWENHDGFRRELLHMHRVAAAYAAVRSFTTTRKAGDIPNFEDQIVLYGGLLWKEMVRYPICIEGRLLSAS